MTYNFQFSPNAFESFQEHHPIPSVGSEGSYCSRKKEMYSYNNVCRKNTLFFSYLLFSFLLSFLSYGLVVTMDDDVWSDSKVVVRFSEEWFNKGIL